MATMAAPYMIDLVPTGPKVGETPYVKHLAASGTESLRSGGLVDDGFGRWNSVADDEGKSRLIRKAMIFSSPVPGWNSWNDFGPDPAHQLMYEWVHGEGRNEWVVSGEDVGDPEDNFKKLHEGIAKLENLIKLEDVGLTFMCECITVEAFEFPREDLNVAEVERIDYRQQILEHFFKALSLRRAKPEYTPVRTLSITNLQNYPLLELTSSEDFKSAMKDVEHLHLYFATEGDSQGTKYGMKELWTVIPWLENDWLEPVKGQLKTLELYFDECWGPFPGWFNMKLVFPVLEKLVVGNNCFAHSDQLEWILAQKSLRILHLHSCFVTSYIVLHKTSSEEWGVRKHEWIDTSPKPEDAPYDDQVCFEYRGTWAAIFDRLRVDLPSLVEFKIINSDDGGNARFEKTVIGCTDRMGTKLVSARYNNYNCGVCPSPWVEGENIEKWDAEQKTWKQSYTCRGEETLEEDQVALDQLLETVNKRRLDQGGNAL